MTKIPSDLAISRHEAPLEFADGAFRNSTLRPDQWEQASSRSFSWHERNPRSAFFIWAHQQASTLPTDHLRQRRRPLLTIDLSARPPIPTPITRVDHNIVGGGDHQQEGEASGDPLVISNHGHAVQVKEHFPPIWFWCLLTIHYLLMWWLFFAGFYYILAQDIGFPIL
jgi:hypothetical protein